MAEHESSLAVLVDFENMARPGAKGRGDFDIHLVLNRLAEKGRVLVKRAYADWSRYRDARHELQNAGLGLIEMPSAREGAKNRADIQMAVDAMELAYSREHVDNFVIVSGDSDFTPLVGKLRELNKRVIGVGNRESASELLIANCDEFIFYDRLAAEAAGGGATRRRSPSGGLDLNPTELLRETLTALQREGTEWPLASIVKDSMRRKYPAFDESEHGFSTFSKFLEDASTTGIVRLETDPRSGTYRVELGESRSAPPVPTASAAAADRSGDDADGGRRRRRRGGRGRSGAGADGDTAEAAEAAQVAEEIAEVFEVVVTPTPDPDVGTLPPLDEPISYEDMIMLGPPPEVGDDVPELAEATDTTGAPSRSSRRRRRRGAGAEPEPTVEDLEPVDGEAPDPDDVVEAAEAPGEEAPARRRRRRRATAEDEAPAAAEAPTAEADAPAAEAVAEEPAEEPAPGRRRVRRRAAAEEPAEAAVVVEAAGEAPAEEEAPTPRRRTR
ncbi:MAG: NYN domain-containing protein [Thermoleophilia bacterium]